MWDEVNEENKSYYFPGLDCVGGLCREHSSSVNLELKTWDHAVSIASALEEYLVHYPKEVSVIALGSYDKDRRNALPILLSPTCKRETPEESGELMLKVIDAYYNSPLGYRVFCPIYSSASDGDGGRRVMNYSLFMKYLIGPDHALYKRLGRCPGLNLQVGPYDITADVDWKHEIKQILLAHLAYRNSNVMPDSYGYHYWQQCHQL